MVSMNLFHESLIVVTNVYDVPIAEFCHIITSYCVLY